MHVGVADHLGWAVVVVADGHHRVLDRRRIELVEPGVHPMPVHHGGEGLDDDALAALIEDVRSSSARAATAALAALAEDLHDRVEVLSLRTWPDDFPTDVATVRRPPHEARADAIMYRQVLAAAAGARGWAVRTYDARRVVDDAGTVLGRPADPLLRAPRAALGPPWTKDHRIAYAAAITAGATPRP